MNLDKLTQVDLRRARAASRTGDLVGWMPDFERERHDAGRSAEDRQVPAVRYRDQPLTRIRSAADMTTVEDATALLHAPGQAEHPRPPAPRPRACGAGSPRSTTRRSRSCTRTTAMFFFVVGGIEALFIRLQLAQPERHGALGALGTTSSSRCTAPRWCSSWACRSRPRSATTSLPLMIGARDVAFPRLNMFGYWVFLFGGIFLYSSFALGGAPDGGWFGYAPLTSTPMSQGLPARSGAPTSGPSA